MQPLATLQNRNWSFKTHGTGGKQPPEMDAQAASERLDTFPEHDRFSSRDFYVGAVSPEGEVVTMQQPDQPELLLQLVDGQRPAWLPETDLNASLSLMDAQRDAGAAPETLLHEWKALAPAYEKGHIPPHRLRQTLEVLAGPDAEKKSAWFARMAEKTSFGVAYNLSLGWKKSGSSGFDLQSSRWEALAPHINDWNDYLHLDGAFRKENLGGWRPHDARRFEYLLGVLEEGSDISAALPQLWDFDAALSPKRKLPPEVEEATFEAIKQLRALKITDPGRRLAKVITGRNLKNETTVERLERLVALHRIAPELPENEFSTMLELLNGRKIHGHVPPSIEALLALRDHYKLDAKGLLESLDEMGYPLPEPACRYLPKAMAQHETPAELWKAYLADPELASRQALFDHIPDGQDPTLEYEEDYLLIGGSAVPVKD